MASAEAAKEEANFKTIVLKVSIHCEACKRKVFKILSKIEGVESIHIETRQNKVSFKSLVDAQTVIQKLKKHGKPAELLQEVTPSVPDRKPVTETEKLPEPVKIGVESNSPPPPPSAEVETVMTVDNSVTEAKETKAEPPENPEKPPKVKSKTGDDNTTDDALKLSEEKSKKVEEFKVDHHIPRQVFPPQPQPTYVMSYDMAQPSMSQSHFVPPMTTVSSQGNIYDDQYRYFQRYYDGPVETHPNPTSYMHQQSNDPYNTMFSDENPDASCSLM